MKIVPENQFSGKTYFYTIGSRSDDTRFTDDTTRSDPEPLLDVSVGSNASGPRRPHHR